NPLPSLTVTGTTTVCSGTSSISLTYSSPVNSPDQYAIQWGSAALSAGFSNQAFAALSGGTLSINNLQSTAGNYAVDILIKNSSTGCQSTITSGTVCSVVAENATLSLSSPNGAVFTAVNFASYGTPTGSCGSFATSTCHAATSSSVVSALAIGQSSFSVTANNATFGDPCVGTVKQLAVQATYGFTVTISAPLTTTISGSSSVCEGSSVTLTSSAASTYSWSTGETTQSIVVSPTNTTTYTVNTTNGGCLGSGTKTVSVIPAPTVTLSTTSPVVCSGTNTATITYSNPQNSPDRYSITWTPAAVSAGLNNVSNATLSGGSFNISNIPSTTGTYPALITISNSSTGCSSYYSAGTLCATAAENATLSMTAPSGNRFIQITFASYGTPTGSCGSYATSSCHSATSLTVVQNAALGQNSFTLGATNGNFGDPCSGTVKRLYVSAIYSPFTLTVNAIPGNSNASSNSPVCTGNTINLSATAVSGVTYSWTGPGGFTSTTQNPSFTATSTSQGGVYSVRTLLNGCYSSGTGSVTVTVNQAPSATISYASSLYCTSVTSPQSVILTGTSGGSFSGPGALSLNNGSGAITPSTSTAGGPYTVTYTIPANGGCAALNATTSVTIAGLPTGVTV
ncbi:MAG TPA: hypothetical protein PKK69_06150, partial [Ferruginibacter sp.]|nr:hypothetical protein [Ferruginibacter sp.]